MRMRNTLHDFEWAPSGSASGGSGSLRGSLLVLSWVFPGSLLVLSLVLSWFSLWFSSGSLLVLFWLSPALCFWVRFCGSSSVRYICFCLFMVLSLVLFMIRFFFSFFLTILLHHFLFNGSSGSLIWLCV